ncbi:hypothetical protein [Oerskovia enterophila]|uniref:hypothetical protein n=1 Tax=Oerskovia enterophila TaxID=43678 RepID=UPI0037FD4B8C
MTGSVYDTRDRLRELADTWPRLEAALGGLKGVIYDDMPKPASKERQLPINAAVSDLMAEIRDWAAFLARTVHSESDAILAIDPQGRLRGLATHAEWLTAHPELGDHVATEAADWITKAQKQLNPGHRKARMPGCRQPGCNGTYSANNGRLECSTGNPLHAVNITRPPTINEAALTRLRQAATR